MDKGTKAALLAYARSCHAAGKEGIVVRPEHVIALLEADERPPLPERKRVKAGSREVAA